MTPVAPATLRAWIDEPAELAILDAREEGEFGAGHLFWAVPCPLSRVELRAPALLPRRTVRIVCVDAGAGEAARLAAWLERSGCPDVHVLSGGTPAWAAAGYVLFSGINVPSKAFGEWVEHRYGTQSIDAAELAAWQREGRDLVVLDSRPFDEFHRMSIPGGVNVPGGELVWRIGDLAPDPATTVVVNCAGRTRSILGAESLRRAGVPNPVVALRNGTMGWQLAGLQVATGRTERFPPGRPAGAAAALDRARAFAGASGVGVIGPPDLARFEEDPDRTLYALDVRDPAEFRARHRAGTRNAPGGQLVQATDQWIAVRGARIALLDDDGVRARMTAAWLRLMGHRDVFVVEGALAEASDPAMPMPDPAPAARTIAPDALAPRLAEPGLLVVDLARSVDFRDGHLPGAVWAIRSRLDRIAPALRAARTVVLTSPDGVLARLAVAEAQDLTTAEVLVLEGGTQAWRGTLHADRQVPPDAACIDVHLRPYDRNEGVEDAMRDYLSWEVDLLAQVARDGSVRYG